MKRKLISATTAGALMLAASVAAAQGSAELESLREQLSILQGRLEQLEKQQKSQQESQDKATDAVAQVKSGVGEWVGRFQWKGDLRYRNEQFNVETVPADRIRDRIRARAGFIAKINDTWRSEVQLATGGPDPRSSNQTLDASGSRKDFELDLAYAEWNPNAMWRLTLGKQKQPWAKPGQSMFFDSDVNPEGVALNWTSTVGLFADAFYYWLQERGAAADSSLLGGQLGWRNSASSPVRFTLGLGYYDYGAVQGYDIRVPLATGSTLPVSGTTATGTGFSPFGNTALTRAQGGQCRASVSATGTCFLFDYNIAQVFGELVFGNVGGRPLSLFADYAQNGDPDANDTAYSAGVNYGRITNPWSWELGYLYQEIEKDALFGQLLDSDFGDGNTDAKGSVFRFGLGITRNFNFNATYLLNDLNVSGLSGGLQGREYQRLQLDLNYRF